MSLYKKIYYNGSSILPLSFLRRISAIDVLLPYHHLVSDEHVPHISNLYTFKNQKQFTDDLDFLLKHYTPTDPIELIRHLEGNTPLPKRSFLLSFDDGLREVYDVVAPILTRRGVPAIFFLNPAFLNNQELFYRCKLSLILEQLKRKQNDPILLKEVSRIVSGETGSAPELYNKIKSINYLNKHLADELGGVAGICFDDYLRTKKPFLDDQQVMELIRKGFYIGGHSIDHPNYNLLSRDEQVRQTVSSCKTLQQKFNLSYSAFSFPHEDEGLPTEFFNRIAENDYKVDILFGTQNQKEELSNRMLHRFNAERPEVPLRQVVKGLMLYNGISSAVKKNHPVRK